MAGKSQTFIFLACINIFGFTRTIAEYREKRKLQWFAVFAFGFMFLIVCGIGLLELYRSSDILLDIEDIKDDIAALKENVSIAHERKRELLRDLRQVKVNILKVSCHRHNFYFWDRDLEGLFCIKRETKIPSSKKEALNYCGAFEGATLFKMDRPLKFVMMKEDHPIDKRQEKVDSLYWTDGGIVNGRAEYSNGTDIPTEYRLDSSGTDPCLAVQQANGYKIENRPCNERLDVMCEIQMTYEKDELEIEAEERFPDPDY